MASFTRNLITTSLLALAAASVLADEPSNLAAATLKQHIMITPRDMAWGECSAVLPPGARCAVIEGDPAAANALFTFRIRMPDNYRIAPHFHPADEHITVLAGVFKMGLGEKFDAGAMRALSAGSFAVMPKGTRHFATTEGETVLQVHAIGPWGITYANAADDPRKKK
jgi:quercetin dioxygenase-like cupin family protein